MSAGLALRNLSQKALRRLLSAHKPLVRAASRRSRAREFAAIERRALSVEDDLASVAGGREPILAGPWLGEVGYEVLYWLPFLRWFQHRFKVAPERLVAFSRGGVEAWYEGIATRYLDIFDELPPSDLAALNERRQHSEEGGGRKQFTTGGDLEQRLLAVARGAGGLGGARVLPPAFLFRIFRDVWQGNLAPEFLWSRTAYARHPRPARPPLPGLPAEYVAVKLYTGTALPDTTANRERLRTLIERLSWQLPVVLLETGVAVDDHADFALDGARHVMTARPWMTPRTNLGLQTALIAHARHFVGTCGGLAWLAPFMGVPTTAVYADDRLLAPHLMLARQAGSRVGAAAFSPVDLGVLDRLGLEAPLAAPAPGELE